MNKLQQGLKEYREKIASGEIEAPERLNPVEKALANHQSKSLAIRAFCYQCMGEGGDPGWQNEIRNCTAPKCALYNHRPYRS